MPEIEVTTRRGAPEDTRADTRVVGLFEGEAPDDPQVKALVESGEAKAALRKVALAHEQGPDGSPRRVLVAGLGKHDELDAERARVAAASVAARARELGARSLSWAAPADRFAGALVEGTLLRLYSFERFKSTRDEDAEEPVRIVSLEVAGVGDIAEDAEQARVACEAQNAARDLQNLPSNFATPAYLAERAREIAGASGGAIACEVLERERIAELGMGAFGAVAQGSDADPKLIVMRYDGGGHGPHLGFVGKGVTFDTGGISIKPSSKMHEMKFDMSGAAATIEALGAIARLGLPAKATGIVPATENMPSGRAVKPGDIVTAMNGKTIEVNNTDAEGRLLLADALCYAVEQGCERLVDLATLTGAIVVALGNTYAGLYSNNDEWYAEVERACEETGELGWRMPLHPEYLDLTKGKVADLANVADERKASSNYAAEFLRQFVDERPWVHMDIAGTAWGMTRPYVGSGASGFGVRSLIELARRTV